MSPKACCSVRATRGLGGHGVSTGAWHGGWSLSSGGCAWGMGVGNGAPETQGWLAEYSTASARPVCGLGSVRTPPKLDAFPNGPCRWEWLHEQTRLNLGLDYGRLGLFCLENICAMESLGSKRGPHAAPGLWGGTRRGREAGSVQHREDRAVCSRPRDVYLAFLH